MNTKSAKPKKSEVGISSDGRDKHNSKAKLDCRDEFGNAKVYSGEVRNNKIVEEKN